MASVDYDAFLSFCFQKLDPSSEKSEISFQQWSSLVNPQLLLLQEQDQEEEPSPLCSPSPLTSSPPSSLRTQATPPRKCTSQPKSENLENAGEELISKMEEILRDIKSLTTKYQNLFELPTDLYNQRSVNKVIEFKIQIEARIEAMKNNKKIDHSNDIHFLLHSISFLMDSAQNQSFGTYVYNLAVNYGAEVPELFCFLFEQLEFQFSKKQLPPQLAEKWRTNKKMKRSIETSSITKFPSQPFPTPSPSQQKPPPRQTISTKKESFGRQNFHFNPRKMDNVKKVTMKRTRKYRVRVPKKKEENEEKKTTDQ